MSWSQAFSKWASAPRQDDYPVWGIVSLWGKVVEHEDGYRAEHALIQRLVVPLEIVVRSAGGMREPALGTVYLGDLLQPPDVEMLGRRYGVEVEVGKGIESAV